MRDEGEEGEGEEGEGVEDKRGERMRLACASKPMAIKVNDGTDRPTYCNLVYPNLDLHPLYSYIFLSVIHNKTKRSCRQYGTHGSIRGA